jgi:hypothetical protein
MSDGIMNVVEKRDEELPIGAYGSGGDEKMKVEKMNRMSPAQRREFLEMASTEETRKIMKFVLDDEQKLLVLKENDGSRVEFSKIKLFYNDKSEFRHLVMKRPQAKPSIVTVSTRTGYMMPFSSMDIGEIPHMFPLDIKPEETIARLTAATEHMELRAVDLASYECREAQLVAAQKNMTPLPNVDHFWDTWLCQNYKQAVMHSLYSYKQGMNICNLEQMWQNAVSSLFTIDLQYLWEIDLSTIYAHSSLQSIPHASIDETKLPRLTYKNRPRNMSLTAALIVLRTFAMQNKIQFSGFPIFLVPVEGNILSSGSKCFRPEYIRNSLNLAMPTADMQIIDTGDFLRGSEYDFTLCTINTAENKPCAFYLLTFHRITGVVDTIRAQSQQALFQGIMADMRMSLLKKFTRIVQNVGGMSYFVHAINFDRIDNVRAFVDQTAQISIAPPEFPPKEKSSIDTEDEARTRQVIKSWESHRPFVALLRDMVPDGTPSAAGDDDNKAEEVNLSKPLVQQFVFDVISVDE